MILDPNAFHRLTELQQASVKRWLADHDVAIETVETVSIPEYGATTATIVRFRVGDDGRRYVDARNPREIARETLTITIKRPFPILISERSQRVMP